MNEVEPTITSVRETQLLSPIVMLSNLISPVISTLDDSVIVLDSIVIDLQLTNGFKSVVPLQLNPLEIMR